jgi:hypothetical protein
MTVSLMLFSLRRSTGPVYHCLDIYEYIALAFTLINALNRVTSPRTLPLISVLEPLFSTFLLVVYMLHLITPFFFSSLWTRSVTYGPFLGNG